MEAARLDTRRSDACVNARAAASAAASRSSALRTSARLRGRSCILRQEARGWCSWPRVGTRAAGPRWLERVCAMEHGSTDARPRVPSRASAHSLLPPIRRAGI